MKEYNYIVWIGGSVIGEYESLNEAQEVADDWILDGYEDTRIELKEKEDDAPEGQTQGYDEEHQSSVMHGVDNKQ